MASSGGSAVAGFYNAPVSKALIGASVAATVLCAAAPAAAAALLLPDPRAVLEGGQVWRLLTSLLPCETLPAGLATWLLLYWLRLFERQMGSSKFAAFVCLTAAVAVLTRALLVAAMPGGGGGSFEADGAAGFAGGPAFVAFGLLPLYALKVPALVPDYFRVCGQRFSDKSMTYLLAAQLLFSSGLGSLLPGLSALLLGLAYANDLAGMQRLRFPRSVRHGCRRYVLPLLWLEGELAPISSPTATRAGPAPGLGAARRPAAGAGPYGDVDGGDDGFGFGGRGGGNGGGDGGGGGGGGGGAADHAPMGPEPPEESVERLVGLGFERGAVVAALRRAFGDEEAAANFLLGA